MNQPVFNEDRTRLINDAIDRALREFRNTVPQRFSKLVDAIQYSLEGGGKRLRPQLVLASGDMLGIPVQKILPAACAVEFIHTYSLIHDDLPAIDDDDTRRGKPSSHRKFGEAVAILAGDALLTEAFGLMQQLMKEDGFGPKNVLDAIGILAHYGGIRGMVGGQHADVTTDPVNYTLPEVEFIHIHKTGALILASVLLPTCLVPTEEGKVQRLKRYGETLGLAFQISDDLLDSGATLRYSRGPRKKPKPSYTRLMSPVEIKIKLNHLIDTAVQTVATDGARAEGLVSIAEFMRARKV